MEGIHSIDKKREIILTVMMTILWLCPNYVAAHKDSLLNHTQNEFINPYRNIARPADEICGNDFWGRSICLSSLRGKWVIVCFWSPLSRGSMKELKFLQEYEAELGEDLSIIYIGVYCTKDEWKEMILTLRLPSSWTNLYCNNNSEIFKFYQADEFPTTYFITPTGLITAVIRGYHKGTSAFYIDFFNEIKEYWSR